MTAMTSARSGKGGSGGGGGSSGGGKGGGKGKLSKGSKNALRLSRQIKGGNKLVSKMAKAKQPRLNKKTGLPYFKWGEKKAKAAFNLKREHEMNEARHASQAKVPL